MGLDRDLEPARMNALATPTTPRPQVGKRTELGRYILPDGTVRLVIGQRIDGSVRFLLGDVEVLVCPRAWIEDCMCGPRRSVSAIGRAHAVRQKRRNDLRQRTGLGFGGRRDRP